MANTAQAKKRVRQNEKRRLENASLRSKLRTFVKKVVNFIAAKDASSAETAYKAAVPVLDSMASKGIIHKNKAARNKSRLNAQIKELKGVS